MKDGQAGRPAALGIAGWHDSGKTVLAEVLIRALAQKGVCVCAVKHAAHGFQMDQSGSDSARMWHAGAATVILVGPEEVAIRHRAAEVSFEAVLGRLAGSCDLVLVEGFKTVPLPRIVIQMAGADPLPVDDAVVVVHAEAQGLRPDSPATERAVRTVVAWLEQHGIISF